MLKPEPAVFHHMLDKLQIKPKEVGFIDDNPSNTGAEAVGITGVTFTIARALKTKLQELGLKLQ